jgi:hypothetical protein
MVWVFDLRVPSLPLCSIQLSPPYKEEDLFLEARHLAFSYRTNINVVWSELGGSLQTGDSVKD